MCVISSISIHASHAGRDTSFPLLNSPVKNFNPRVPCGTRHCQPVCILQFALFQSTRPMRDATEAYELSILLTGISIHASHAGRDSDVEGLQSKLDISIHASHAGRDMLSEFTSHNSLKFQSTRPMRDATVRELSIALFPSISIHASHAGRDNIANSEITITRNFNPRVPCGTRLQQGALLHHGHLFQSTRPMRDATSNRYNYNGKG